MVYLSQFTLKLFQGRWRKSVHTTNPQGSLDNHQLRQRNTSQRWRYDSWLMLVSITSWRMLVGHNVQCFLIYSPNKFKLSPAETYSKRP